MSKVSISTISETWLYEMPFITIITSSVETYSKECCGLLLGYRSLSHWDKIPRAIIEQAYPFQIAERTSRSVTIFEREDKKCKNFIYLLSMFEPLGYFHSHPEGDPTPTKEDIESMNPNEIELIVAIKKKGRTVPWSYNLQSKVLSGVLGDFRFELSAFALTEKKKIRKLDLLCPFALGIGSKYFDIQAKPPE